MINNKFKFISAAIGTVAGISCLTAFVCVSLTNAQDTVGTITIENTEPAVSVAEVTTADNSVDKIVFDSEKDEIWHKMLNTIDYFNSVSGKMIYSDNAYSALYLEYQTDIDNTDAYTKVTTINNISDESVLNNNFDIVESSNSYSAEVFTSDDSMITLDNINKTAEITNGVFTRENSEAIADDERVTVEEDGMPGYHYRCDATNTYIASASLFPQEMTFGFLTDYDLWNVDGTDEYVGRECYVISGKTSDDYGSKLDVVNFQFYVDCETGVLLKYIGYDESGNISGYIITEEIDFDNPELSVYKPSTDGYAF